MKMILEGTGPIKETEPTVVRQNCTSTALSARCTITTRKGYSKEEHGNKTDSIKPASSTKYGMTPASVSRLQRRPSATGSVSRRRPSTGSTTSVDERVGRRISIGSSSDNTLITGSRSQRRPSTGHGVDRRQLRRPSIGSVSRRCPSTDSTYSVEEQMGRRLSLGSSSGSTVFDRPPPMGYGTRYHGYRHRRPSMDNSVGSLTSSASRYNKSRGPSTGGAPQRNSIGSSLQGVERQPKGSDEWHCSNHTVNNHPRPVRRLPGTDRTTSVHDHKREIVLKRREENRWLSRRL